MGIFALNGSRLRCLQLEVFGAFIFRVELSEKRICSGYGHIDTISLRVL